jgi:beta-N-acetylhexosaminidase
MSTDPSTDSGRRPRRLLALAGVLMALAAIVVLVTSGGDDGPAGDRAPASEAGSRFRGDERPEPATGKELSAAETERRVARLFVAGFATQSGPQRVWGGVLVSDANYASPQQLRSLVRTLKRRARREDKPEPMVVADPATLGNLGPQSASEIGADGTQSAARDAARRAARRVRTAGVEVVLAPSADLGVGGGPAELRAFGDDPRGVAAFVFQAVDGWLSGNVLPVPGRFPGEGAASQDPLEGPATVGLSLDELVARDVRPFAGVVSRAPAMQLSAALYAAWDGVTPATLSPDVVRLLRRRLGFEGAIVSADLNAATAATGEGIGKAAVEALKAGCDVLYLPGGREEQDAAFRAVVEAVRSGELPFARLAEALKRADTLRATATRT